MLTSWHLNKKSREIAAQLEKCGTPGKMQHTRKNAAHLEKCGTLEKMRHT